jgi:hypothetical protein
MGKRKQIGAVLEMAEEKICRLTYAPITLKKSEQIFMH